MFLNFKEHVVNNNDVTSHKITLVHQHRPTLSIVLITGLFSLNKEEGPFLRCGKNPCMRRLKGKSLQELLYMLRFVLKVLHVHHCTNIQLNCYDQLKIIVHGDSIKLNQTFYVIYILFLI